MSVARLGGLLLVLAWVAAAHAAPTVSKNVPYSADGGRATSLDVYAPAGAKNLPVMVWIHGGAWQFGDKGQVQAKPEAFGGKGFVLVSINYRMLPDASPGEQAADVAQALGWVHAHIQQYGGDADRIFVMGHSAGAHLAALVATDNRYLERQGMHLRDIKGVILLDGAAYDVPRQLELAPLAGMKEMYLKVFGDDPAVQRDVSPISHVAAGKGIPPFLILHVADRRDSRLQSEALAEKLSAAGSKSRAVPAEGKTHMTINSELGEPDDAPTAAVFEFLDERLHQLQR